MGDSTASAGLGMIPPPEKAPKMTTAPTSNPTAMAAKISQPTMGLGLDAGA